MLYIVSTPIGNMKDITLRAVEALKEADCILVEDTRKAGVFLKQLGIPKRTILSFYEHNEEMRIPQVIERLRAGQRVVLLSGAGTPLVSDPGFKLLRRCIEEDLEYTALPGASSAALRTVSCFWDFCPRSRPNVTGALKT